MRRLSGRKVCVGRVNGVALGAVGLSAGVDVGRISVGVGSRRVLVGSGSGVSVGSGVTVSVAVALAVGVTVGVAVETPGDPPQR